MKIKVAIYKDRLIRAFKEFPQEAQKEFRIAMKQAAQLVAEEAKDHHKFQSRSGKVEDSIKFSVNTVGTEAEVYLDKNIAMHGIYIHEGTKAHMVYPKKYKVLRFVLPNGRFGYSKGHKVSGIKPEPFLEYALASKRLQISTILSDSLNKVFKKVGFK